MKCHQIERRLAADDTLSPAEHLHALSCDSCRRYTELFTSLQTTLPKLVEPDLGASFDTLLAQRVLSAARQPAPPLASHFSWWPRLALSMAVKAGLGASLMALALLAAGQRVEDMRAWAELFQTGTEPVVLGFCALLLLGLLGSLWLERGRRWLRQCGLLASPGGTVEHVLSSIPRTPLTTINPIYGRYLSLWNRHLTAAPAVLAVSMAVAAPWRLQHAPWLSMGLLLLWALAQGLSRGYFAVSTEAVSGTFELVRVTGMSPREMTSGYLLAALVPTGTELLAGSLLLTILAIMQWMPVTLALACITLAWSIGGWACAAGLTFGRGSRRLVDATLLSALALLGLVVAVMAKAAAMPHLPAAQVIEDWSGLCVASSILFGCLAVVLLHRFEQGWESEGTASESRSSQALKTWHRWQLPAARYLGPFVSVAIRTYLRAWQRHATRQTIALVAVLVPLAVWGPERGMPATMLMFLLWGFAQAFRLMDREHHRAVMALFQVTPMSSARLFGGQLLTAVLPLSLPWTLHCGLALYLQPALASAILAVSGLSMLLGLTGATLGLLNRYAISLDFEPQA